MDREGLPNCFTDHKEMENQLLANIEAKLPELETLLEEISSHWVYEDSILFMYRRFLDVFLKEIPLKRR